MITREKLKIFEKYLGDIDCWARNAKRSEISKIADEDWALIETLIQDIRLIKNNLTSTDYINRVKATLREKCDNTSTIKYLEELANDESI